MNKVYQVYQVSDSTGETLDRIFLAIKAQFSDFECNTIHFSFTRTENQVDKIISKCETEKNVIILYTIVDNELAKYLAKVCKEKNIPCFEVLGNLINDFSKLLKQEANRKPSGQHTLDQEYYRRIEAIQFTMSHDDGKIISDLEKSDIILVGVSRTSKTPTSVYLANRGYKTSNIPIVNENSIPEKINNKNFESCIVGLTFEAERLYDVRKNRLSSLREKENTDYVDLDKIKNEIDNSKKIFQKNQWPTIDVTRKSVEETAASVIKIYEIKNKKNV